VIGIASHHVELAFLDASDAASIVRNRPLFGQISLAMIGKLRCR
jgi:hypothetical protein